MEIPVASDGRVGSALRAAWCHRVRGGGGGTQHGVSCLGRQGGPALHATFSVLRKAPSTGVRARKGGDAPMQTGLWSLEKLWGAECLAVSGSQ